MEEWLGEDNLAGYLQVVKDSVTSQMSSPNLPSMLDILSQPDRKFRCEWAGFLDLRAGQSVRLKTNWVSLLQPAMSS